MIPLPAALHDITLHFQHGCGCSAKAAGMSDVCLSQQSAVQDGEGHAVPMSRHQVHQDQPEAVNKLLLDYLQNKVCHVQV